MLDLLKGLSELPGPPGQEEAVQARLRELWGQQAQEIELTPVGNLLAHIGGRGPKLMMVAHADEIGLIVKSISPQGFLWVTSTERQESSRPTRAFPGQPVLLLGGKGPVEGVLATVTGHVMTFEQRRKAGPEWRELFIDVGASSEGAALALGLSPGTRAVWNPPLKAMGKLICGKALDDRVGLAVLSQLLEILDRDKLAYDLWYASTVQEEIGLVGAASLFRERGFDFCLVLDCGQAGDIPLVEERDMPVKLGRGPVLVHKDSYVHYARPLISRLAAVAREADIPIQNAVFNSYGSDGAELVRQGVPAALLAPPTRYTHSPFEMVHEEDLAAMVALLRAFLYH